MKMIVAGIAVIAALVLVGSGQWPFTNSGSANSEIPLSITIGASEPFELIHIADDQGYFAENGLNVTIRNEYSTPKAFDGMLNGDVDIAFAGEYTAVTKALEDKNFLVIASIDKFETLSLYGRKDRGIEEVSGLEGKKIGLTRGSPVEFFTGRFLDLHGMSLQDVTIVDLQPSQYVDALVNGSVDSVVSSGFFIDQFKEQLGNNLIRLPIQSSQPMYYVAACRSDWAASNPDTINRFLKSLAQAEEFTINHPTEAKAIIQERLNFTDEYIATIWPQHQFSLTLDQSLLMAMNDEGRWMIKNNLTSEKTLPYFRDYIHTEGLEAVKPDAVNII
jgi:ABC-type nitrate/sulfonate/bicarbonate transport system substrate-binding protein